MSDKVYIGPNKVGHFEKGAAYPPLSRVTMWYDDEHFFTAGDDTGYIMTVDNPWATQEIVNDVYNQLKGFVYQPFEATGVSWDPSIELGDAVNIGGIYSMIGRREVKMGKEYIANISCPGEKEIDHDFPRYSKTERELKRRVKLGNKYQGVKIDRQNGLTITETDGEKEGAKVVLNSKEFSFYDAGGGRVLYFDPTSGTYKFLGELNVNDKFVVDKDGNVKLAGNINLGSGSIFWGDTPPNKKRYAASTSGPWHDTMQSGDIYCCDWDYNAKVWKESYKFKGQDGTNGSDASVNRSNVERALAYAKSLGSSFMAVDSVGAPIIYGGKIYGSEIYAGGVVGNGGVVGTGSVISLTDEGIVMHNSTNGTNLEITSVPVPGVGMMNALFGGSALLLNAQQIMIGLFMGTPSAIGIGVSPSGTEFAGSVHFSGKVTGITATFA